MKSNLRVNQRGGNKMNQLSKRDIEHGADKIFQIEPFGLIGLFDVRSSACYTLYENPGIIPQIHGKSMEELESNLKKTMEDYYHKQSKEFKSTINYLEEQRSRFNYFFKKINSEGLKDYEIKK
jgi:hypothetical protein